MDVILILLCFWPEMRSVRLVFLSIIGTVISMMVMGLMLTGEIRLLALAFLTIPFVIWLIVEIWVATRAWRRIDWLYEDQLYQANPVYYDEVDRRYEAEYYQTNYYDQSDDFFDQDEL